MILAIDPSFCNTGWSVWDGAGQVIDTGCIRTEKTKNKMLRVSDDTAARIQTVAGELAAVIQQHKVAGIVAELPSGGAKSAAAAKAMGIATAIVACTAEFHKLPAEYYTPMDVKKALAHNKVASKEDMEQAAAIVSPIQAAKWAHQKGKFQGRYLPEWEHIADSIGCYEAAKNGNLVRQHNQQKVTNV